MPVVWLEARLAKDLSGAQTIWQAPTMTPMDDMDVVAGAEFEWPEGSWQAPLPGGVCRRSTAPHGPPWPRSWASAHNLAASIQSRPLSAGAISRLRCLPTAAGGLAADIEAPREDSIYALHVLAGEISLEQCERTSTVRGGGLIAIDATRPARLQLDTPSRHDIIALTIPRHRLVKHGFCSIALGSPLSAGQGAPSLLAASLSLAGAQMQTAGEDELNVLFEACASLLALASQQRAREADQFHATNDNVLLRAMIEHVDKNIADRALCPAHVARRFSISTRYLHKLFKGSGTTFSAYLLNRRLDEIRGALGSAVAQQPIAALATSWGFADISTFNRAFKKRFGCTPRRVRAGARR